jgi:predicted PurR-regulated permease PerM
VSMDAYLPQLSPAAQRWVRFGALVVGILLLLYGAYYLRAVITPLLVALALAYILNPVVTWLEHRRQVPRINTVTLVFTMTAVITLIAALYLGGQLIAQVRIFQQRVPVYVDQLGTWFTAAQAFVDTDPAAAGAPPTTTTAPETQPAAGAYAWWPAVAPLVEEHGVRVARSASNYLLHIVSNGANLLSLLVLIPVYTFFFLWRFNDIVATVRDHLPAPYRTTIVHVAQTIDAAIANFFRGRLIVCLLVGLLNGIGWSIVGVPYSVPLGVLSGVLNLVPFMSMLALPPALLFAYLGAEDAGAAWLWPVIFTMGVYMLVQALESFALSPLIEGQSSGLHPLVIVVAILIGGQLAGLLGMLLAIPIASTLKTLAAEFVLPEVRRVAGESPPTTDATPADPEPADAKTDEHPASQ